MKPIDIAVVGGGASGLMAALSAGKRLGPGKVVVLEKQNRVGKKLAATGNGRCNLTNMSPEPWRYHGADVGFMRPAMSAFPPETVRNIFEGLGLMTKEEAQGKVYPTSDQASSVLDVLRLELESLGVQEKCEAGVQGLNPIRHGFELRLQGDEKVFAQRVIWAPGGQTAPNLGGDVSGLSILKALGHPVAKCFPALVQLKTPPEAVRALKGIKYEGEISIWVDGENRRTETGEVLFTDYGLSGPPVLQLSRWASLAFQQKRPPTVEVSLCIWPEDFHATYQRLKARARALGQRTLQDFLTGWLNKRLGQTLVKFSGGQPFSRPCSSLSDKELRALAHLMTDWRIPVVGVQGFAQAQVTAGGLDVRAFDAKTLESRLLPGLYCAGEVLDIDGDCGGFNLQWAWASGLLAAQSACDSL